MSTENTPAASAIKINITLDNSNYNLWSMVAKPAIDAAKQWNTDLDRPEDSSLALSAMFNSIHPDVLTLLAGKMSASAVWDHLKSIFAAKGMSRLFSILKAALLYRPSDSVSMLEFGVQMQKFRTDLLSATGGTTIKIDDLICLLALAAAPSKYDTVTTAITTSTEDKSYDLTKILRQLHDAELDLKSSENTSSILGLNSEPSQGCSRHASFDNYCFGCNPNVQCRNCKQKGHTEHWGKCPEKRRRREEQQKKAPLAGLVGSPTLSDQEYGAVDSGAHSSITNSNKFIEFYKPCPREFAAAEGSVIKSPGSGTLKVSSSLSLDNVSFCPKATHTLLSVAQLCDMGLNVLFDDRGVIGYDRISKDIKLRGKRVGNLYNVLLPGRKIAGKRVSPKVPNKTLPIMVTTEFPRPMTPADANAYLVEPDNSNFMLWHRRMGHLNGKSLKTLSSKSTGISSIHNHDELNPCISCITAKAHRLPSPSSTSETSFVGEVVHSDIVGPFEVEAIGGYRYFVVFTDDYSRWSVGYLLPRKSDAYAAFVNYSERLHTKTGKYVEVLRTDNGGEFTSNSFAQYCNARGTKQEFTVPYSPNQNGTAERKNRTLVESMRALLHHAGYPKRLWGESFLTAIYLQNRSPHSALDGATPYFKYHAKHPDLSHIRVFGTPAFAHIPKEKRQKLDPKSSKHWLVGFSEKHKAYKLVDANGKFTVARDVVFPFEHRFHLLISLATQAWIHQFRQMPTHTLLIFH